jgi:hypothetical protein
LESKFYLRLVAGGLSLIALADHTRLEGRSYTTPLYGLSGLIPGLSRGLS